MNRPISLLEMWKVRQEIIEECARLVEDGKAWHRDYTADPIIEIASAIRALKDKP